MLISLRHRFLFVANLRSGSTSIERLLRRHSEIAISQTKYGKHLDLAAIHKRFAWIGEQIPWPRLFTWGVIRDPVDYVVSLYNFHRRETFRGQPHYTGSIDFETFWDAWTDDEAPFHWMLRPQCHRFRDASGSLAVDYIVDFARLNEEWPGLCERMGVPSLALPVTNRGEGTVRREDVPDEIAAEIRTRFADDVRCLREMAGRPLREAA